MPKKIKAAARAAQQMTRKDVREATKILTAMGYKRDAAREYTHKLIEQGHSSAAPGFENRIRTAGAQRRADFAAQASKGVTARGRAYIDWMTEAHKYAPELMDYAEAAAEGRYKEALAHNRKVFEQKKQEAEEMAEQFRQEAARLTGDARAEAQNYANYWNKRAEIIDDLQEQYGTGKPKNIKYMPGYKTLENLFK